MHQGKCIAAQRAGFRSRERETAGAMRVARCATLGVAARLAAVRPPRPRSSSMSAAPCVRDVSPLPIVRASVKSIPAKLTVRVFPAALSERGKRLTRAFHRVLSTLLFLSAAEGNQFYRAFVVVRFRDRDTRRSSRVSLPFSPVDIRLDRDFRASFGRVADAAAPRFRTSAGVSIKISISIGRYTVP